MVRVKQKMREVALHSPYLLDACHYVLVIIHETLDKDNGGERSLKWQGQTSDEHLFHDALEEPCCFFHNAAP